jgi:L-serine dehydratase
MFISTFEMFSIGVGPSSSHTVGPMRAAYAFVNDLRHQENLVLTSRVQVDLFGSLALTGLGHATDKAILMGFENELPESVDPHTMSARVEHIKSQHDLFLGKNHTIHFDYKKDLILHQKEFLPKHSNAMRFTAYHQNNAVLFSDTYYSIGGGFILNESHFDSPSSSDKATPPYIFHNAVELLKQCNEHELSIAQLMMNNEKTWHTEADIKSELLNIANIMQTCIYSGCYSEETHLPGGLNLARRAPKMYAKLQAQTAEEKQKNLMNWMNLYALAVNEENAAGGRVVTAPTNGAAGIIPAVLQYYREFIPNANDEGIIDYLLTAAAIGILYKKNASISAAEVGCQGEVGVACSMAAGALTAALGGSVEQIEKAAEMGMEHHLGLTCDPVHGLVQIPCIERNTMGTVQAVNCAQLALIEDDTQHYISLDKVIETMFRTGKDMSHIYKETSLGGLAVNIPSC